MGYGGIHPPNDRIRVIGLIFVAFSLVFVFSTGRFAGGVPAVVFFQPFFIFLVGSLLL